MYILYWKVWEGLPVEGLGLHREYKIVFILWCSVFTKGLGKALQAEVTFELLLMGAYMWFIPQYSTHLPEKWKLDSGKYILEVEHYGKALSISFHYRVNLTSNNLEVRETIIPFSLDWFNQGGNGTVCLRTVIKGVTDFSSSYFCEVFTYFPQNITPVA